MENQEEDTQAAETKGASPADDTAQDAAPSQQEQYLFYNVMPKNTGGTGIVAPSVNVVETTETLPTPTSTFFSRNKVYIIIGIIIILIAVPGFWYLYSQLSKAPEDDLLTKAPPKTEANNNQLPPDQSGVSTPGDWQVKYWGNEACSDLNLCSDGADPDRDGLTNLREFQQGTDPNNNDSDQDKLADGDEVNVFLSNPLKQRSNDDERYTDADYAKGGYSLTGQDQKFTAEELAQITERMKQFFLHEPTVGELGVTILLNLYKFENTTPTTTPATETNQAETASSTEDSGLNVEQSPEAKQDRDAQRANTIKNILVSLAKYQEDHETYPATASFSEMINATKPYNKVATNPVDPINKDPFVYAYASEKNDADFTLSFYSESANLIIKKHAVDAVKEKSTQEAALYDDQRKDDLELLRSALLLYSNKNVAGNQNYVFPTADKYKTALVPEFMSAVPKDPVSGKDYEYKVSEGFDSFTLKAILQNPPSGNTGYICNQEDECDFY